MNHKTCPNAPSGCNWPESDCLDLCMPVQVVRWPEDDEPAPTVEQKPMWFSGMTIHGSEVP